MNISNWMNNLVFRFEYKHPPTYDEELDNQCRLALRGAAILGMLAWLPYIPLDKMLIPEYYPLALTLRAGFTILSALIMLFSLMPKWWPAKPPKFMKYRHYFLLMLQLTYLSVATGVLEGLAKGNPAYIGGYCIVIMLLVMTPVKVRHFMLMVFSSLIAFLVVGLNADLTFDTPDKIYSLLNLCITIPTAMLCAIILGLIRKHSYSKNRIIQKKVDERMNALMEQKGLSKRETEVLTLLLDGKSNSEIEHQLFIAISTVKTHVTRIYQKLGVKTRMQLSTMIRDEMKNI